MSNTADKVETAAHWETGAPAFKSIDNMTEYEEWLLTGQQTSEDQCECSQEEESYEADHAQSAERSDDEGAFFSENGFRPEAPPFRMW